MSGTIDHKHSGMSVPDLNKLERKMIVVLFIEITKCVRQQPTKQLYMYYKIE